MGYQEKETTLLTMTSTGCGVVSQGKAWEPILESFKTLLDKVLLNIQKGKFLHWSQWSVGTMDFSTSNFYDFMTMCRIWKILEKS